MNLVPRQLRNLGPEAHHAPQSLYPFLVQGRKWGDAEIDESNRVRCRDKNAAAALLYRSKIAMTSLDVLSEVAVVPCWY